MSLRERSTLSVVPAAMKLQAYFSHLEFALFDVGALLPEHTIHVPSKIHFELSHKHVGVYKLLNSVWTESLTRAPPFRDETVQRGAITLTCGAEALAGAGSVRSR